jgi:hypothetical protein
MAVNRRKKKKLRVKGRQQHVHGVIPGTLLGVLVVLAVFALGYLYISGRNATLGERISELEKIRDNIKREIYNEEFKWSRMTSTENMERLIKQHGLDLIWPSGDAVVRLQRDPPPLLYAEGPSGLIAHD